jgi:hypothetical protein
MEIVDERGEEWKPETQSCDCRNRIDYVRQVGRISRSLRFPHDQRLQFAALAAEKGEDWRRKITTELHERRGVNAF